MTDVGCQVMDANLKLKIQIENSKIKSSPLGGDRGGFIQIT